MKHLFIVGLVLAAMGAILLFLSGVCAWAASTFWWVHGPTEPLYGVPLGMLISGLVAAIVALAVASRK